MGLREVESAVLAELREVSGVKKLRLKDIREWSTGDVKVGEGEVLYRLPVLRVNAVVARMDLSEVL